MKKRIIWIGLAILIIVAAAYSLTIGKPAVSVEQAIVKNGNIDEYVEEAAVVKLTDETSIYTAEAGKVLEVMAEAGQEVKKGDVLLRMDEESVKLQIQGLEAERQSVAAQYAAAKEPAKASEINKLAALVKSAEAAYNDGKRAADSSKALYESGAVSLDAYQTSLSGLAAAEANLEAAKSSLTLAQQGISDNVKKQYEAQLAAIDATIELQGKRLADLNIVSPIDGIVLTKNVEEGSMLQPGMLLFEIGGKSGMYLEADILIEDIADVKEGAQVLIENEDLGIESLKGTVRKIYPKAFSKMSDLGVVQKRIKAEIDFSEGAVSLRSGYDMTVKIITESKDNALLINEKAVFEYQGKDHVFVNENGTARLRTIEKGLESDDLVEVLSGLKDGEKVILSPDEKLEEGAKIK